ncbi:hypothetical protein Mgra_00001449 [Meloidogyne graminicola]|uniref:Uncharacterized protein n=1 Tax=Meloidogyne graminicola TaxID=189291 RepID=A0A8T0A1P0_9BILA|nr:hypothetical protein Mgra_00001449 [Meloidogyne graminicola]
MEVHQLKRPLNALQQIASTQQNLFITTVPEPRYMKEMTTTIMRVAAFSFNLLVTFCLIQLMPSQLLESVIPNFGFDTLKWRTTFSSRIFDSIEDNNNDNEKSSSIEQITSAWLAFWCQLVILCKFSRKLACSERRQKRYTIPQQIQQQNSQAHHSSGGGSIRIKYSSQGKCSQNNCNSSSGRSRNGAFQVFRFFYSLNSHRSSASIEADGNSTATILPGNPNVCVCICGSNAQQHLLSNNNNNENKIITTKQPICCSPKNSNSLLFLHAGTSYSALALCCVECNCNCGGQSRKHSAQSAISNLFYGGGEKTSITTTLSSASTLAASAAARRSPQTNQPTLGEFGWRDGRAHTYCAPIRAIPSINSLKMSTTKTSTAAHLRVAQQIITATFHGGDLENNKGINNLRQGRRESAAERRELFAQMKGINNNKNIIITNMSSPLPPPPPIRIGYPSLEEIEDGNND